ncbi:MAG: hypothetical protein E7623_00545 [Ruminococcaceae bacterium]|nr:hypothetical protein [Oscillospiraceae bacterium]
MDGIDLSEVMNKMVENPDMLKKAMEAARKMMGTGETFPFGKAEEEAEEKEAKREERAPATLPVEPINKKEDGRTKLLLALKPYLNEKRREKIDLFVKLMGLLELADAGGILKSLK